MGDFLSRMNGEDITGLVAIIGCLIFAVSVVMAACWVKIRKAEISAALKQDMLNRGMSADQIKIVIEAGTRRSAC